MKKYFKTIICMMLIITMVIGDSASSRAEQYAAGETGPVQADTDERRSEPLPDAVQHDDEIVRVSIVLDEPAVLDAGYKAAGIAANAAANSYRESLADAQASLTERIEQNLGRPLNVKWNLTLAVNVISAEVRRGDIALIEK
ncbi:MAG: hypothetical protein IJL97_02630, partial [Lachnospiraceae bacterium]|nr:hypothetical protein [Lachnospiraceae bacterium]